MEKLRGRSGGPGVLARLCQTDDFDQRAVAVIEMEPLADRVLAGPVTFRQFLIHNGNAGVRAVSVTRNGRPRMTGTAMVSK
jgi:hypothetical protein